MKNLHLIATDKPSRLQLNVNTKKLILFDNIQSNNESVHLTNQNIYITSDEKIEEGDKWIYNIHWNEPQKIGEDWVLKILNESSNTFKIILTTDHHLIKDGVQKIDDEFLEWFVKNPSCEEVEVESNKCLVKRGQCSCSYQDIDCQCLGYKIVIPKEEQKELRRKLFTLIKSLEEEDKKETLEEVAERILANNIDGLRDALKDDDLFYFYKGVIQSYGEAMAKWQQEQDKDNYSEKDMEEYADFCSDISLTKQIGYPFPTPKRWFEQFKKK